MTETITCALPSAEEHAEENHRITEVIDSYYAMDPDVPSPKGRPSKRTPERVAILLDFIRQGNEVWTACTAAQINPVTFRRWVRDNEEFRQAVALAEAEAEISAVETIVRAKKTNWRAAAFWLERRRAETWGRSDRLRVEASLPIEDPLNQPSLPPTVSAEALAELEDSE